MIVARFDGSKVDERNRFRFFSITDGRQNYFKKIDCVGKIYAKTYGKVHILAITTIIRARIREILRL